MTYEMLQIKGPKQRWATVLNCSALLHFPLFFSCALCRMEGGRLHAVIVQCSLPSFLSLCLILNAEPIILLVLGTLGQLHVLPDVCALHLVSLMFVQSLQSFLSCVSSAASPRAQVPDILNLYRGQDIWNQEKNLDEIFF